MQYFAKKSTARRRNRRGKKTIRAWWTLTGLSDSTRTTFLSKRWILNDFQLERQHSASLCVCVQSGLEQYFCPLVTPGSCRVDNTERVVHRESSWPWLVGGGLLNRCCSGWNIEKNHNILLHQEKENHLCYGRRLVWLAWIVTDGQDSKKAKRPSVTENKRLFW